MRLLPVLLALVACGDQKRGDVGKTAPEEPKRPAHGAGRDRWRGGGVYLDGMPIGALRYAELPDGLQPIWETQRRRLPFKAGEEIKYEEKKVPRFRIADYLKAIRASDFTEVHLHGGRDSAIILTRAEIEAHPDEILFKFAGETWGKPIPVIRDVKVSTSFDDMRAMTIYKTKKPPTLTAEHTLVLEGFPVKGIPYYGEPMKEGIRVYRDGRMVAVLKRNLVAGMSKPDAIWNLSDVLAKQGVVTTDVGRVELIYEEQRTEKLAMADMQFVFDPAASGEIKVGTRATPANAIALYSK